MSTRINTFDSLADADLVVDAVYEGGTTKNVGSDPLARLLPVGNQGGFRFPASRRLVVLFSSFADPDWPDSLTVETGQFIYYGDNKRPGHELHDTPRSGNALLRDVYAAVHSATPNRAAVPPFLIFARAAGWAVKFCGLAVPGAPSMSSTDDLVAVWKSSAGQRFQNYKAAFTVIDVQTVKRAWLQDVLSGIANSPHAPSSWSRWVHTGQYEPLRAERTLEHRRREEQTPSALPDVEIIRRIHDHFKDDPYGFEECAVEIARFMDPKIVSCDLTRARVDGGRDAVGTYQIGGAVGGVKVEFALEAKCFALEHAVGVHETARLISRLRHRQFGVLVTTSYVHSQAYKELKADGHPVVILAARDIVELLKEKGIGTPEAVQAWLDARFPPERHVPRLG
jgi:hypothetical protein